MTAPIHCRASTKDIRSPARKTSLQTLSDGRNHYLHMLTGSRISRPVEILSFIHLLTSGGSSQVFPIRESKTWSAQLESIGNFCKQLWLIKYPVSEFIMSMNLQLWDRERRLWSPQMSVCEICWYLTTKNTDTDVICVPAAQNQS